MEGSHHYSFTTFLMKTVEGTSSSLEIVQNQLNVPQDGFLTKNPGLPTGITSTKEKQVIASTSTSDSLPQGSSACKDLVPYAGSSTSDIRSMNSGVGNSICPSTIIKVANVTPARLCATTVCKCSGHGHKYNPSPPHGCSPDCNFLHRLSLHSWVPIGTQGDNSKDPKAFSEVSPDKVKVTLDWREAIETGAAFYKTKSSRRDLSLILEKGAFDDTLFNDRRVKKKHRLSKRASQPQT
ncbi:uncharacterized protein RJT20DRAFT_147656 [Scheffersomyces xylosifermentans]|uniref:uncharacterized protein n=1 Tax=Scheffersomyces xylosifermentans TaxID=1304137 RepID=UPI00315D4D11